MAIDRDWILSTVQRYERPLLAYVGRLLGDPDRSRDVVQDAFLQLCKQSREKLDIRVAPWLYAVCRRRVIDILRKEKRMTATETMPEPTARGLEPSQSAELHDSTRLLLVHLADLPANENEVVRLRFHDQFTYREIAEVTGLSESHVGVLLHQALKKLRKNMPQLA